MKEYLILIAMILVISSCGKDKNSDSEFHNGFATAKINGEEFNLKPRMTFFPDQGTYALSFEYYINENVLRKQLSFSRVVGKIGKQQAYKDELNREDTLNASYSTLLSDGDVLGNFYSLNELDNIEDYMELIEFNISSGEVIGKFQGSFYVSLGNFDPSSPDTIIITDGYFETEFYE